MTLINDQFTNILVTGGGGFIGGSVIRRLLTLKNVRVFNLDKLGYASDLTSINQLLPTLNVKNNYFFNQVDLANFQETQQAVIDSDPDLVMHLAAESHVDRSIDNPSNFVESNINGTFNLLEAVRFHWEKLSSVRKKNFRFQHISTDEVFGSLGKTGYFSESTPYDPRSPYSASKAASDHLVRAWNHTYGLPIILTNCSNNYGPWQFPEKLIPIVIINAIKGRPIPIYGDGSNIRDWLYVEDHVDALFLVAVQGKIGQTYCIGGNSMNNEYNQLNNYQLVSSICNQIDELKPLGFPHSNLIKLVMDRPGHDKRYAIDHTKITKELGWKPKHSIEEGLTKTIRWYFNNQQWCSEVLRKSGYSGERLGSNK